jgi:cyanate permease
MGLINGISIWVENIVRLRGFSLQAGNLGGVLLVGCIIGAIIIPLLSDRLRKRKIFLLVGMVMGIPGLAGVIFAGF